MRRIATAVAALTALALPASASADWSRARFVARERVVTAPAFALSEHNGGLVAWGSRLPGDMFEFRVRRVGPRGRLGPVRVASKPIPNYDSPLHPVVAVAPSGAGVVAWPQPRRICCGHFTLAGRLLGARGRLGKTRTLVRDTQNLFGEQPAFDLVVDSSGTTFVTWTRSVGDPRGWSSSAVFTRRVGADGGLGPAFEVPEALGYNRFASLESGSSGSPLLMWVSSGRDVTEAWAARVATDGRLGTARPVAGSREGGEFDLDVDAEGRGTVAWTASEGGWANRVFLRRVTGETLGSVMQPGSNADAVDVEVAQGGAATVAWSEWSTSFDGPTRIVARRVSAAGALGAIRVVTPWLDTRARPQVAVDGDGVATVTWSEGLFLHARRLGPRGRLMSVARLSRRGPSGPGKLALAGAARATIAVWQSGSDLLTVRHPAR